MDNAKISFLVPIWLWGGSFEDSLSNENVCVARKWGLSPQHSEECGYLRTRRQDLKIWENIEWVILQVWYKPGTALQVRRPGCLSQDFTNLLVTVEVA